MYLWDDDLRLAYDVVANAGDLPDGPAAVLGLRSRRHSRQRRRPARPGRTAADARAFNQCTGINLPPSLRSADKRRRLASLMQVAGTTDEDFFLTNMAYATYAMSELGARTGQAR